jgi:iron(III) transport system substrate-binding protein
VSEANLALPYRTPMVDAYPQKYRDPEGLWTATRLSYYSIAYNSRIVAADKVPRTYDDLLDPRWKGKLAWRIGSASGAPLFITNLRIAWGEERAQAYLAKLSDQKIINFGSGSARTLVDRVVAGEYPIALQIFNHHAVISAKKGAPVDWIKMEPATGTLSVISIHKSAPHPNAAKLLVDFLISREGQQVFRDADYLTADPAVPALDPALKPEEGHFRVRFLPPETIEDGLPKWKRIFDELFG